MGRYRVMVEGSGLAAPTKQGGPIRGFFVTRVVKAASAEEASRRVLDLVQRDWSAGRFAAWNQAPSLAAVEVKEVGLVGLHLLRSTGYIFHRGM
jgi:hypothetical protein